MPSVYIETYGCQMNVSDSELMYGKLAAEGYTTQDTPHDADVVLVNTCAIRENAEQRVIGRLGELLRDLKAGAVLGVTGCMAQRLGPGRYTLAGWDILIGDDLVARSPDGSHFVGSTVTVPRIKANALGELGMSEADLERVIDINPRRAIGG